MRTRGKWARLAIQPILGHTRFFFVNEKKDFFYCFNLPSHANYIGTHKSIKTEKFLRISWWRISSEDYRELDLIRVRVQALSRRLTSAHTLSLSGRHRQHECMIRQFTFGRFRFFIIVPCSPTLVASRISLAARALSRCPPECTRRWYRRREHDKHNEKREEEVKRVSIYAVYARALFIYYGASLRLWLTMSYIDTFSARLVLLSSI